ncbi:TetR/AcrR family transcriptional regulator [Seongchinamella sediminis]|nr:TetR/AcrR family transcriptional regulator [Seongchinamella sediminis]
MSKVEFPRATEGGDERRAHIEAAVVAVIARSGIERLTVRAVAAAAGCSKGLVEHYFGNKASLVAAAADWANRTYLDRVRRAVGDQRGLAALEIRLRQLLPYREEILHEWKARLAFWQQSSCDTRVADSSRSAFWQVHDQLLGDVQVARDEGQIPASVPLQETAELVLVMLVGWSTLCINNPRLREHAPLDRRLTMLLNLLRSGELTGLVVGDPEVDY